MNTDFLMPMAIRPQRPLIWASILAVLCLLAGLLGHDLYVSYQREVAIANREADNLTGAIQRHVEVVTGTIDIVLSEAVHTYAPLVAGGEPRDIQAVNRDLLRRESFVPETQSNSLRVIDHLGRVLFSAGNSAGLPDVNVADRAYFLRQRDDPSAGLVVSEPILSRFTGKWLFTLSRRMTAPDGSFAGLIQTAIRSEYFQDGFRFINVGAHGSIAMFSSDSRLIARHPAKPDEIGRVLVLKQMQEDLAKGVLANSYEATSQVDNTHRIFHFRKIPSLPIIINFGSAPEDFLYGWKQKAWLYGGSWLALGLALVGVMVVVGNRAAKIERLNAQLAEQIARAQVVSQATGSFLAKMSHEIRPPHERLTRRANADPLVRRLLGIKILVADDSEMNQFVLEDMLTSEGAVVSVAANGVQAVETVERASTSFDIVLMDVQMPEMDGLEATKRIRQITNTLPVIGQTSYATEDDRKMCCDAGMLDVVRKPIDHHDLVEMVLKYAA